MTARIITWLWILPVVILTWTAPGLCDPQSRGMSGGGMMGPGMHGMMGSDMHGMMGCRGRGDGGPGFRAEGHRGLMASYHAWIRRVMSHKQDLGLSPEQIQDIDTAVVEHLKKALPSQAEIDVRQIELKDALGRQAVDLKKVQGLLKDIADREVKLQMEGIQLSTNILQIFTPEQRSKMDSVVGSPFPLPWHRKPKMPGMGMMGPSSEEEETPPAQHEEHHEEG